MSGAQEAIRKAMEQHGVQEETSPVVSGAGDGTSGGGTPADPNGSEPPAEGRAQPGGERTPPSGDSFRRDLTTNQILLKYKGRDVALSEEEVVNLAQKGWAADELMRRAAEERREIEADRTGLEQFRGYRAFLRQHPELAERIGEQMQRVQQGMPLDEMPAGDLDEIDASPEEGGRQPAPVVPPEMRQFMQETRDRFAREDEQEAARTVADRVMVALDQEPILREASAMYERRKMDNVVLRRLTEAMHSDPSGDTTAIAKALATEYQPFLGAAAGIQSDEGGSEDDDFRSESPSAAPVSPSKAQGNSFGAEDLKSGRVGKAAQDFIMGTLVR